MRHGRPRRVRLYTEEQEKQSEHHHNLRSRYEDILILAKWVFAVEIGAGASDCKETAKSAIAAATIFVDTCESILPSPVFPQELMFRSIRRQHLLKARKSRARKKKAAATKDAAVLKKTAGEILARRAKKTKE